jgi:branched-chain amino acid transport system permease protein
MAYFLQQLANAVPLAALYGALAFGYALVFGLTKRTDFAFGALFAFSGQVFLLFSLLGWERLWLVLPATITLGAAAAFIYTAGASFLHATRIVRPLLAARPNAIVAASLAVMIVLMETARIGTASRALWFAPVFNAPVTLFALDGFAVTLTRLQIVSSLALLALVLAAHFVLVRSSFGRIWRAVRDDGRAAALLGVDVERVLVVTYCLAALVAAVTGILATLHYGTMDFGASLIFGLKVVFIAAIGGALSPGGAALGAAAIALGETLWSGYAPLAWRDLAIFAALVFVLNMRRRDPVQP